MKYRKDGSAQIQNGGCKITILHLNLDGLESLDAIDQRVEEFEADILACQKAERVITAKRDEAQEMGRALLRRLHESTLQNVVALGPAPAEVKGWLRLYSGGEPSGAELKELAKKNGALAENQSAAA